MAFHVELLRDTDTLQWNKFVNALPNTQMSHTLRWRDFLKDLTHTTPIYLKAMDRNGKIQGLLPGFLQHGSYGPILNSLPFFGSNGGIISKNMEVEVYIALWKKWHDLANENNCIASTIITSPYVDDIEIYDHFFTYDFTDRRIGQITNLEFQTDPEQTLFQKISSVRRRNIRKAIKSGVTVKECNESHAINFLAQTHRINMKAIGGRTKPKLFFQLLQKHFKYGKEWKLYIGFIENQKVAGLLLFYFNNIVEYFVPVIDSEYRSTAAQCLVIFRAMIDASKKGFKSWNWGGTWSTQEGVYAFKNKWATEDLDYKYYTKLYSSSSQLFNKSPQEILNAYPYFYVAPFHEWAQF